MYDDICIKFKKGPPKAQTMAHCWKVAFVFSNQNSFSLYKNHDLDLLIFQRTSIRGKTHKINNGIIGVLTTKTGGGGGGGGGKNYQKKKKKKFFL